MFAKERSVKALVVGHLAEPGAAGAADIDADAT